MRFLLIYFIAFTFILNAQTHYNYNEWEVKPEKGILERTVWRLNLIPEKKIVLPPPTTSSIDTIRNKDGKIIFIDTTLIDLPDNKYPEPDSIFISREKYNESGFPISIEEEVMNVDYLMAIKGTYEYDFKNRLLFEKSYNVDSTWERVRQYVYDDTNKIVSFKEWRGSSLVFETTYKYDAKNRFIRKTNKDFPQERSWKFGIVYSRNSKTGISKLYADSVFENTTKIKFQNGKTVSLIRYDTTMKIIHQTKQRFKGNNGILDVRINEKGIVYQKQKYFYLKNGLIDHCDEYNDKNQLKYRYQANYKYR